MQDKDKSKEELLNELSSLRKKLAVKQKEEEIKKTKSLYLNLYKKVFLTTNDHFSIISTDYKYIEVNNSYLKSHGIKRKDIVNRKISDVFGKDVFEKYIQKNIDTCIAGQEINYSKWFEFPIGKRKFMQARMLTIYCHWDFPLFS